ncbi:glycine cleavage system aminomethyltransferase T [Paenibacillus shirakamiensis]|uniref:Glycine cleavage system aminomethyltransferase T n=1 Tax=Paenibacillus shirakamiensis TaxID=1265935 RepID=A0ABS4JFH2_9BACL|nr:aminomethyltransferase family protein [Paenibacillus shirakamiensis]MBP2000452.1 glycine cleavage system aminomethyltransferase T [Paenibacillus shirakamiensis]
MATTIERYQACLNGQVSSKRIGNTEVPSVLTTLEDEYHAIRNEVALLDLSFTTRVSVSGTGALQFLQQLVTRDLEFLSEEQTLTCLLLHENGTIAGEIIIYVMHEYYLIEIWPQYSEEVLDILEKNKREDVTLEDVSDKLQMILLEGPRSWEIMQQLVSFPIEVLPYKNFALFEFQEYELFAARLGYTAEYGYKIFGPSEAVEELWSYITTDIKLGENRIQPIGIEALEVCRLEVRFPDLSSEATGYLPVEAGVNWLMDLRKEFVGKGSNLEVLENGLQRKLVCFKSTANEISPNQSIVVDGETIGHIQHVLYSPGLKCKIGVSYIDVKYAASGITYALDNQELIESVSSPMIYAKSLSIRMA